MKGLSEDNIKYACRMPLKARGGNEEYMLPAHTRQSHIEVAMAENGLSQEEPHIL